MEGKWKWAIGQMLAENNSQQHMAGHQKCSPPWRISLEIPEEFWAYHFHRWLRHRRRSPLLLPVCQVSCRQRKDPQLPGHLLWPGRALWKPFSLLKHWYSCSGNDRFPCGLKAAKCACVAVTLFVTAALSVQRLRGTKHLHRKLTQCPHTENGVSCMTCHCGSSTFCNRKELINEVNNVLLVHT